MPNNRHPNFSLPLDILRTLEKIGAPYMIIGAFAAIMHGVTRTTYDIDIVVDLTEEHIDALVAAYPSPRFYADPYQMRDSIRIGMMFNIIDSSMGEKADLVPLSMEPRYRFAFQRRVRKVIEELDVEPFEVWCARPEDIIFGKLMAWYEGRSRKHETDIYEMMAFNYFGVNSTVIERIDEAYIDEQAKALGQEVVELWNTIKSTARQQADIPPKQ